MKVLILSFFMFSTVINVSCSFVYIECKQGYFSSTINRTHSHHQSIYFAIMKFSVLPTCCHSHHRDKIPPVLLQPMNLFQQHEMYSASAIDIVKQNFLLLCPLINKFIAVMLGIIQPWTRSEGHCLNEKNKLTKTKHVIIIRLKYGNHVQSWTSSVNIDQAAQLEDLALVMSRRVGPRAL